MIIVIYYREHSKQAHQKKVNPTLCSGRADLAGIRAELLRDRCSEPFAWQQRKEHKHTDESSVLSCLVRSSLSRSWIKRAEKAGLDESPWFELTHELTARAAGQFSLALWRCASGL